MNGYYNLDDVAAGQTTDFTNPSINAALLSVNHSFRVQNYQYGEDNSLGTIGLYGAVSQRYRGPSEPAVPPVTSRTTTTTHA